MPAAQVKSSCSCVLRFHCPQDMFFEKHGVKLGFMSAFVKAAAYALNEVPAVNAGAQCCLHECSALSHPLHVGMVSLLPKTCGLMQLIALRNRSLTVTSDVL